ncbi:MAG: Extracellular ligand-binding receptor, partial [Rhodoferax sp.]|nr:Extracellular ligand-binding receptor [Rhodoferax sp.]
MPVVTFACGAALRRPFQAIPATPTTHTTGISFAILPLAAALAMATAPAWAQETQTVRIGHAGPVSGGIAHIGKDTENGVRMALDELNTQNVVIGGKKIRFEIAAEDDGGDPRQATAVAQKMCDAKVA